MMENSADVDHTVPSEEFFLGSTLLGQVYTVNTVVFVVIFCGKKFFNMPMV